MTEKQDKTVDRRRLLRRAGTVAAGVAGTTVVGAAVAAPAQAAPGDPVVQGATNAAGNSTTALTSTAASPTLRLANTSITNESDYALSGPALQLVPSGDFLNNDAPVGSVGVDQFGNYQVVSAQYEGQALIDYVHTTGNSNRIVPILPQRLVDTRSAAGRRLIVNPSSTTLDSSGRVRDGQTIHLDLRDWVFYGDALFGNLTVTTAVASGFVQIFPYGVPRPTEFSTINYLTNQVISNSFMSGIGYDADFISVYVARATHVIIDVVAFVVGIGSVNPEVLPFAAGAGARSAESVAARAAKRTAAAKSKSPKWQ
ncbi:hypothetical protein V6V47_06025 [Micromonospora sp. CPCC 205539]|uniref:hypothetical protein n=1 Tax=Micromonospora sp. CPCC 205539 TaxID=3122408 RepID=UPI002FF1165A